MVFNGEYKKDPDLQVKAVLEVEQCLRVIIIGNYDKIFKMAQKSWKQNHSKIDIILPRYNENFELQEIQFYSDVMLDAKVLFSSRLGTETKIIRFVAEKRKHKTDPKAPFRFNPSSMLRNNL